jgi:glycine/D-amino acid oxidase-like deaminating enzyme
MTAEELAQVPDRVEVVVVGLGLKGTAATWALARCGHEVVAFDAHRAGHRYGSSHGSSRIFRRAYPEAEYVAMTGQALELWRELERAAGATLLVTTGGLDHGRDHDPATRRRMSDYVRRFWPGLDPEPVAERDCLYTWTSSQDFLVARYGALVVCSARSGHAAKFTPLIGEWLADLVERRPLSAARLAQANATS